MTILADIVESESSIHMSRLDSKLYIIYMIFVDSYNVCTTHRDSHLLHVLCCRRLHTNQKNTLPKCVHSLVYRF